MTATLHHGDVLEVMRGMESDSFDAVLTDPPYHLTTGKRGGSGPASVNLNSPAGRSRVTTGFMGMEWDGGDVAFRPETWAEALRVLKPGAFALVFGGSRTFHRLAVALEDAGFELRDTLCWLYAEGFPKSKNLDGEWAGFGSALKPAWEPIILVRKPTRLTFAANALEHGCGALNIDGARVSLNGESWGGNENHAREDYSGAVYGTFARQYAKPSNPQGRWPANVAHDGSEEAMSLFPHTTSGKVAPGTMRGAKSDHSVDYADMAAGTELRGFGDAGSAARFFYCGKASRAERDEGLHQLPERTGGIKNGSGRGYSETDDPYRQIRVRNNHPTVKPLALTRWLATLLLPPERATPRRILVPFSGSGSEIIGALHAGWDEADGIERESEYITIARARIDHWTAAPLFDLEAIA